MSEKKPSSEKRLIPFWAQGLIGAAVLILVVLLSLRNSTFVSDWSPVDSNFYKNAMDALRHSRVNIYQGPVPTVIVFWDLECKVCKKSLRYLSRFDGKLNIVGVHIGEKEADKIPARKWWLKNAPRKSPLYFDNRSMLEKTFQIRAVPVNFLIFPLEKKMLNHVGDLKYSKPKLRSLLPD